MPESQISFRPRLCSDDFEVNNIYDRGAEFALLWKRDGLCTMRDSVLKNRQKQEQGKNESPRERLPLILLPGMMCDERMWADIPRRINAACGPIFLSSLCGADSIEMLASQILDVAPPKFSLAGLSMGGIVAIEVLRQAPERVARLALLNTNARPDASDKAGLRARQVEQVRQGKLQQVVQDELKPTYPSASRDHDLGLKKLILDMALKLGGAVFEQQSLALANRQGSLDFLPEIRCPVLVICGREDSLCPVEYHLEIAALVPHANLKIIPECGHLSTLEHPAFVAEALTTWLQAPLSQDQNRPEGEEALDHE
jgi:pimeloyl-ACP methyl ester carboxylesterase